MTRVTGQVPYPTALITGGTTGIGLAAAQVPHAQGFAVLVTGRDPATLAAARAALPGDVSVVRADADRSRMPSGSPRKRGSGSACWASCS
jgi:short-subunit dehydrogenase involved in D-alanine esterification of teichoic acids